MKASLLCLLLVAGSTLGARILGIFPTPSISHQITSQVLMKALAARGHHVTVLSTDPLKVPLTNYTDIDMSFSYEYSKKLIEKVNSLGASLFVTIPAYMESRRGLCDMQLSSKQVQDFIKSQPKFDLVFYEDTMFNSYFGLIHLVGSPPIIAMHIHDLLPTFMDTMGNPSNPAYVPNAFLPFTDHMNFWQRAVNTMGEILSRIVINTFIMPDQEVLMRKYFGDGPPSVVDTAKNFSLYMVNRHDSLSYPRPLLPNFIDIGGLHMSPKINRLPKDLQDYVDGAKNGFIYFSLGSNVKTSMMSKERIQDLMDVFAQLPQRVLFKWEEDTLPGLPKNVKVSKWMPQQELLAHPNIRLFISHGGIQSTFEAVKHAVPLLGFPFAIDQPYHMAKIVSEGAGISLDYKTVTKEDILISARSVLKDVRYRENMQRLSTLLKDQPETPLQRAVWWTEYVLRHKGAKHLRSAALDLSWYQYYLLDVASLIIGALAILIFTLYIAFRPIFYYLLQYSAKSKRE